MLSRWEFRLPTSIRFAPGGIYRLGEAVRALGNKAMLVGYRNRTDMEKAYGLAAKSLADAGISGTKFYEVVPDPKAELAEEGAEIAVAAGVEVVIALGGGSVIDAAKGIAALSKESGDLWQFADANPDARPLKKSLPIVAVPTTAGTGAEVTSVAVFTFSGVGDEPDTPYKAIVEGPAILPAVALIDPDLTATCPAELRAACGADALGHALEACMSRRANPISSVLATRAISLIVEHLPRAVRRPGDPAPLAPLALASTLAGTAFNETGLTITHSIAHALGAILHIPHGRAVGIATPWNLRYNAEKCVNLYSQLAATCGIHGGIHGGIDGGSPDQRAKRFVDHIAGLLESIGIRDKLELPPDAPDDIAVQLAQNAIASTPVPVKLNPRKIDQQGLAELFEKMM